METRLLGAPGFDMEDWLTGCPCFDLKYSSLMLLCLMKLHLREGSVHWPFIHGCVLVF